MRDTLGWTIPSPVLRHQQGELPARFGDLDAAVSLLRETLDQMQKTMGTRHPDTLVGEGNLAITLRDAGQGTEAIALQRQVVGVMAEGLGADHPNVDALFAWRLRNRDLEAQPT